MENKRRIKLSQTPWFDKKWLDGKREDFREKINNGDLVYLGEENPEKTEYKILELKVIKVNFDSIIADCTVIYLSNGLSFLKDVNESLGEKVFNHLSFCTSSDILVEMANRNIKTQAYLYIIDTLIKNPTMLQAALKKYKNVIDLQSIDCMKNIENNLKSIDFMYVFSDKDFYEIDKLIVYRLFLQK